MKKITYPQLKKEFENLFKKADAYCKAHPDAELEYDEMGEEDPTLGFKHREGRISVHTVFVLHRYGRKKS